MTMHRPNWPHYTDPVTGRRVPVIAGGSDPSTAGAGGGSGGSGGSSAQRVLDQAKPPSQDPDPTLTPDPAQPPAQPTPPAQPPAQPTPPAQPPAQPDTQPTAPKPGEAPTQPTAQPTAPATPDPEAQQRADADRLRGLQGLDADAQAAVRRILDAREHDSREAERQRVRAQQAEAEAERLRQEAMTEDQKQVQKRIDDAVKEERAKTDGVFAALAARIQLAEAHLHPQADVKVALRAIGIDPDDASRSNLEGLKVQADGTVEGLEERIAELKRQVPVMFAEPPPTPPAGGQQPATRPPPSVDAAAGQQPGQQPATQKLSSAQRLAKAHGLTT